MASPLERPLKHAANRAATRPAFVAYVLRAYTEARGFDDQALADELGVGVSAVDRLALCRRPSADAREAIHSIADALRIDASRLANLLNAAEAAALLKGGTLEVSPGILAAARRRRTEDGRTDPNDGPEAR